MTRREKAVARGDTLSPIGEVAIAELYDCVTRSTCQVMMMARCAEAIAGARAFVMQTIEHARISECIEGAIHRRKPELRIRRAQSLVQRLRGDVIRFGNHRLEHSDTLRRDAQCTRVEHFGRVSGLGHARLIAVRTSTSA